MSILIHSQLYSKNSELNRSFLDLFVRERKALRECNAAYQEVKRLERKLKKFQLRKRICNITGINRIENVNNYLDVKILSISFELFAQTQIHKSCKETMNSLERERVYLELESLKQL